MSDNNKKLYSGFLDQFQRKLPDEDFRRLQALAWSPEPGAEPWSIASDESADLDKLADCALRFDIEVEFLDEKSQGFQLEDSLLSVRASLISCIAYSLTVSTPLTTSSFVNHTSSSTTPVRLLRC